MLDGLAHSSCHRAVSNSIKFVKDNYRQMASREVGQNDLQFIRRDSTAHKVGSDELLAVDMEYDSAQRL